MLTLEHAHRLANAAPGPAFCTDPTGACTFVNAGWTALTGLELEGARGDGWTRALHPEDTERLFAAWTSFITTQSRFEEEFRFVNLRTETSRWVRAQASALRDDDGALLGFFGLCTDVEDLYETQRRLEERARLLQMSDATMNVGHWHVESATGRLNWSEEVHRIHGTDPATYEPRLEDGLSAFHPEDRAHVAEVVQQATNEGRAYTFEARLLRADGAERIVRSSGRPTDARTGDVPDIIGVFQDVTEQRDLTRRLAESEQRYALAVAASRDGLWDWDITHQTLWWSERFKEILGLGPEAFEARFEDFSERLHPEDREATLAAVTAHVEERTPFEVLYRLQHEEGHWVWIQAKGQASWDERGQATRMVGTVADVTAEVEAQQALEQKTLELERSNRELERFASVASHDMKEPLRKIQSFVDRIIARNTIEDARTSDYLQRIKRSADRMYAMVDDLLEVARVTAGARHRKAVSLNETAEAVVESLAPVICDAEATVELDSLPEVDASATQMQQLLHNLMENALKYRARDRAPIIRVRPCPSEQPGFVGFEVEDNGIGFAPEHADRIFLLFERLHGRSEYSGNGMGLALCKKIVEEHGGRIAAQGSERGATFRVELPAPESRA